MSRISNIQASSLQTSGNNTKGPNMKIIQGKKRTALMSLDNDYVLICGTTGLERFEIDKVKSEFSRFDDKDRGYIMRYEVDDMMRNLEYKLSDDETKKFVSAELAGRDQLTADFHLCCDLYSKIKKRVISEEEEAENLEYIDAFVALGGNFDRSGFINKDVIINTIKAEFGLILDIEKLFEEAHISSNNISFSDFVLMFESHEDSKSLISAVSNQFRQTQLTAGFKVKFSDFEQWNQRF